MLEDIFVNLIATFLTAIIIDLFKKTKKALKDYSQLHKLTFRLRCFILFFIFCLVSFTILITQVNIFSFSWFLLASVLIISTLLFLNTIYYAFDTIEKFIYDYEELTKNFNFLNEPDDTKSKDENN